MERKLYKVSVEETRTDEAGNEVAGLRQVGMFRKREQAESLKQRLETPEEGMGAFSAVLEEVDNPYPPRGAELVELAKEREARQAEAKEKSRKLHQERAQELRLRQLIEAERQAQKQAADRRQFEAARAREAEQVANLKKRIAEMEQESAALAKKIEEHEEALRELRAEREQ